MTDHLPTADLSDHEPPVLASADAAAAVQHVAVLGTGIMGAGMARSLLRAGHQVSVWNRTYERAAPLGESGAIVATNVAECVHDASVVITMLFDTAATLEVKPELLESMNPRQRMGPVGHHRPGWSTGRGTPDATASRCERTSFTREPAEAGALVTLTSGPAELARRAKPVVEGYSSKVVDAGRRIGQANGAPILREATAEPSFVLSGVVKDMDIMPAVINNTDLDAALIAAMRDVD